MKKKITLLSLLLLTIAALAAPLSGTVWKCKLNDATRLTVKSEAVNGRVKITVTDSDINTDRLIVWVNRERTITTEQLTNYFTPLALHP